ncbi:hypothetical protein GCM10009644_37370 [Microbacterium oxydans]
MGAPRAEEGQLSDEKWARSLKTLPIEWASAKRVAKLRADGLRFVIVSPPMATTTCTARCPWCARTARNSDS